MATELVDKISKVFWAESFWLPENVTWINITSKRETGEMYLPLPRDLWMPFPLAIALFIVRMIWERFIAQPIGRYFLISESLPRKAIPNDILEKAYKLHGKYPPKHEILMAISKQTDWSVRHVERWWRRRRVQNKATEMKRFKETSWRFLFYFVAFYYGLAVLWNKEYFWDTRHCWYGYPYQPVPSEIYWYYMVELGFYWSLVLSLFMDIKRKDFVEMIVHHIATIGLMMFSWADGMVRIGTLVLCVHDAVDYWMEGAKLAKYCKFHKLCDALFVIFAVVWFITRIVIYPLRILRSTLNEGHHIIGMIPAYFIYNILLVVLQVLHILWFISIIKMAYLFIMKGQVEKDERSETEPETNSDDDIVLAQKDSPRKMTNGAHSAVDSDDKGRQANGAVLHKRKA